MLHKGRIKAAQAGKATGQSYLGDGHARVSQQLFGTQQPPRLQVLQRRHAKVRLKNPPQMTVAYP